MAVITETDLTWMEVIKTLSVNFICGFYVCLNIFRKMMLHYKLFAAASYRTQNLHAILLDIPNCLILFWMVFDNTLFNFRDHH